MNSFYGCGARRAKAGSIPVGEQSLGGRGVAPPFEVRFLSASTFHGSQSGAIPGPSNPAGCHLSYATAETLDGRDFDNEGYFHE